MGLFEKKRYRLKREVLASEVDDEGRARFPGDTPLPVGTVFVIEGEKHRWPGPDDPLHYTIELRRPDNEHRIGGRYVVPAADMDEAMKE